MREVAYRQFEEALEEEAHNIQAEKDRINSDLIRAFAKYDELRRETEDWSHAERLAINQQTARIDQEEREIATFLRENAKGQLVECVTHDGVAVHLPISEEHQLLDALRADARDSTGRAVLPCSGPAIQLLADHLFCEQMSPEGCAGLPDAPPALKHQIDRLYSTLSPPPLQLNTLHDTSLKVSQAGQVGRIISTYSGWQGATTSRPLRCGRRTYIHVDVIANPDTVFT